MSSPEVGEKSVSDLVGDLAAQTAHLVKQEASLATAELGDKFRLAANQVVFIATALLVASASLLTLVAALVIGLSAYIPAWESATIIGAILAVVALVLYQKSISTLSNVTPVPERTARSLKETKSWVQEQTR
jgi:membrane protein implicated in regulation of membrane protease activity